MMITASYSPYIMHAASREAPLGVAHRSRPSRVVRLGAFAWVQTDLGANVGYERKGDGVEKEEKERREREACDARRVSSLRGESSPLLAAVCTCWSMPEINARVMCKTHITRTSVYIKLNGSSMYLTTSLRGVITKSSAGDARLHRSHEFYLIKARALT